MPGNGQKLSEYFVKIKAIAKVNQTLLGVYSYCITANSGAEAMAIAVGNCEANHAHDDRLFEIDDIKKL